MISDRQITLIAEKHRIFGHFTGGGVIRVAQEVSKVVTEDFVKFIQRRKPKPSETFDDLWKEYSEQRPELSDVIGLSRS